MPEPAFIKVPSFIAKAPLAAPPLSASAVTDMSPLVLVMSPSAAKVISLSAVRVILPAAVDSPSLRIMSEAAPLASKVIIPVKRVLMTLAGAPEESAVIVPSATT